MRMSRYLLLAVLTVTATAGWAGDYPSPVEGDYVIRDFRVGSGESMAEVGVD